MEDYRDIMFGISICLELGHVWKCMQSINLNDLFACRSTTIGLSFHV